MSSNSLHHDVSPRFHSTEVAVNGRQHRPCRTPLALCTAAWAEVVSPRQMKGCRANSLPKWAARIIFLVEEAAHDHDISGRVAAQLRHARRATGSRHRCRRNIDDTAAMSAAATTTAARIAAEEQRHSTNTSRIASVQVGERARSSEWTASQLSQAMSTCLLHFNIFFLDGFLSTRLQLFIRKRNPEKFSSPAAG